MNLASTAEEVVLDYYLKKIFWLLKSPVAKVKFPSQRISVIIIYRPPYSEIHPVTTSVFYSEFSEYLESVVLNTDPVLIVGDFNIHVDCDDNTDAVKLLELFESVGLDQHVLTPTH